MDSTLGLYYSKLINALSGKITVVLQIRKKHSKYTVCDNAEL